MIFWKGKTLICNILLLGTLIDSVTQTFCLSTSNSDVDDDIHIIIYSYFICVCIMYVNSLFLLSTLPCCKVLFASDKTSLYRLCGKIYKKMINFSNVVRNFVRNLDIIECLCEATLQFMYVRS